MNGLVLEGGGARGSYHVGAVKALRRKGIKINVVVGTSIGSINGAFVACKEYKKWERLWKNATSKEFFGIDQSLFSAFKNRKVTKDVIKDGVQTIYKIIKNSGIDTSVLKGVLANNIDEKKLKRSNIDFGLVTYNISKRKPVEIFKSDIPKGKLIEYLIASSYLPVFKFQKIIDDSFYIDGGFYNDCPVSMLLEKNLDNIYVVRTHSNKLPKYKTNSKIIEIKFNESLGSIIAFDSQTTKTNIKLGYYDTLKAIDKLDGKKYYFKNKTEKYYNNLFEKRKLNYIIKKYTGKKLVINYKKALISIIESICEYYKINRFKVYNMPFLLLRLKLINLIKKESVYSKFIRQIKVRFK